MEKTVSGARSVKDLLESAQGARHLRTVFFWERRELSDSRGEEEREERDHTIMIEFRGCASRLACHSLSPSRGDLASSWLQTKAGSGIFGRSPAQGCQRRRVGQKRESVAVICSPGSSTDMVAVNGAMNVPGKDRRKRNGSSCGAGLRQIYG